MPTCENIKRHFIDKLVHIYFHYHPRRARTKTAVTVRKDIERWFANGTASDTMEALFAPRNTSHAKAIWWSGFHIENATNKNPVANMKAAADTLHGYVSFTTELGNAQDLQSTFWDTCSKENSHFRWGVYLSEMYTKVALQHNPTEIHLFLNKAVKAFLQSFFFKVEINIINDHYRKQGKTVTLRIYNVKDNCASIIHALQPHHPNIVFRCYEHCTSLKQCVTRKRATLRSFSKTKRASTK